MAQSLSCSQFWRLASSLMGYGRTWSIWELSMATSTQLTRPPGRWFGNGISGRNLQDAPICLTILFGVSGSPFLDRANNRMFVVGGDGNMYVLNLIDRRNAPRWPVPVTTDPAHEHNYGE